MDKMYNGRDPKTKMLNARVTREEKDIIMELVQVERTTLSLLVRKLLLDQVDKNYDKILERRRRIKSEKGDM